MVYFLNITKAKKFWLFQAVEEWIENPVSQLNSLRQNKWILSVQYAINREDSSKNTSSCTCTVECPKEKTLVVSVEKASQKKAKNAAALKALSIILNQIKEESDSRGKGLLRLILEKYY